MPVGRMHPAIEGNVRRMTTTSARYRVRDREPLPPPEPRHTRITRNLHELLQELRVTQTGVQILTGFLLTLPFSSRFPELTATQRHVYLAVLAGSVVSTGTIMAPVAFHRVLFRRGDKEYLVTTANRLTIGGLTLVGMAMVGAFAFVADILLGHWFALATGAVAAVACIYLWAIVPLARRRRVS